MSNAHDEPIIIDRIIAAPIEKVWAAITDEYDMRKWYFDIPGFKAEKDFDFQFTGGPDDGRQYVHLCTIIEVISYKKLTHSWRYEGYPGDSFVTWELFEEGKNKTRVKLTHTGLESFGTTNPDLAKHNFVQGWTDIVGQMLPRFLENNDYTFVIDSSKTAATIFPILLDVRQWWSGLFGEQIEGHSNKSDDEFTFSAGDGIHYSKQQLIELIPNQKITWLVTESTLGFLKKKDEWTGTSFGFTLLPLDNGTKVIFTHKGLTPPIECYEQCTSAWSQYLNNLAMKLK
jgi:uncharacterized protein YndB with AHSA1/START domain